MGGTVTAFPHCRYLRASIPRGSPAKSRTRWGSGDAPIKVSDSASIRPWWAVRAQLTRFAGPWLVLRSFSRSVYATAGVCPACNPPGLSEHPVKSRLPPDCQLKATTVVALPVGLATSIKHLFMKPVTRKYPKVKPEMVPRYRGLHYLERYEDGIEAVTF